MCLIYYLPLNVWNIITQYLDFETFDSLTFLDPTVFNVQKYSLSQIDPEYLEIFARKYQKFKLSIATKFNGKRIGQTYEHLIFSDSESFEELSSRLEKPTEITFCAWQGLRIGGLDIPNKIFDNYLKGVRSEEIVRMLSSIAKKAYDKMMYEHLDFYHDFQLYHYKEIYFEYLEQTLANL